MLQHDEPCALRLLQLELLDLVGDFRLGITAGLHTPLGITNVLENSAGVLEVVCIAVFDVAQFGKNHANLVTDVRDAIIAR